MLKSALDGFSPSVKAEEYADKSRKVANMCDRVEFVPVGEGEGRVCAGEIGFYPPGTPFIRRGEVFTHKDIEEIAKKAGCTFGLVNGKLVVLQ